MRRERVAMRRAVVPVLCVVLGLLTQIVPVEAGVGKIHAVIRQLFGGQVNASGATNGESLIWNATTNTWEAGSASAAISVEEEDGAPSANPSTVKVPNGTLTDNGDGTASLDYQPHDARLDNLAGLSVANGTFVVGDGTNWVAQSGATARASMGVTIGTDVQAHDAQLDDVAAVTPSDNQVLAGTGANLAMQTLSSLLDEAIGSTRGSVLIRGAAGWGILAPGTSGHVLMSNGAGADPSYQAVSVSGGRGIGAAGVDPHTLNYTVSSSEAGKVFTAAAGSGGVVIFSLPPAAAGEGPFTFVVTDRELQVSASAGDNIVHPADNYQGSQSVRSSSKGSTVALIAVNDTEWFALIQHGSWLDY